MAKESDSWKNWLIASLWTATILLAGAGYNSITKSLDTIHNYQAAQLADWNNWKIEHEKGQTATVRILDKLCSYQADRLRREGKMPEYPSFIGIR